MTNNAGPINKYLEFTINRSPTNRTLTCTITNKTKGTPQGEIHWYHPWRCYVYTPQPHTTHNEHILKDILTALDQITNHHHNRQTLFTPQNLQTIQQNLDKI